MPNLTCKDVTSADDCAKYYVFLQCQPPPLSECYFANCVWSQGACDMEGTCQGGEAPAPTPPAPTHAPTHAPTAPSATPTPAPTPNPTAAPTPAPTQYCDHAGVICANAEKWTSDPSSDKSYGDQAAAWAGGIGFCDADPACKGVANSLEWKGGKQVQYCMGEDLGLGSNAAWTVKEKTNLPSGSQCPTAAPSANPTPAPTPAPAPAPTRAPTIAPTPAPTLAPTPTPTPAPTTPAPTPAPTPIGPFTGANACTEWLAAKRAESIGGPATAPLCEANPPGANTPPGEVASACYGCDARKNLCCDWQHMEWDAWGVQHGKSLARGSVNDGTMGSCANHCRRTDAGLCAKDNPANAPYGSQCTKETQWHGYTSCMYIWCDNDEPKSTGFCSNPPCNHPEGCQVYPCWIDRGGNRCFNDDGTPNTVAIAPC